VYVLFVTDAAVLFIDDKKLTPGVRQYLLENGVSVKPYGEAAGYVRGLRKQAACKVGTAAGGGGAAAAAAAATSSMHSHNGVKAEENGACKVWIDGNTANVAIYRYM
jgi:hypothetical protein